MVFGVGMDIQEIARVERAIERGGKRFLERAFAPAELKYCQRQKRPAQHLAGRFCAKEAFFKALGTGWSKGIQWKEVEVVRKRSGQPELKLHGRAGELARKARIKRAWLSLSHSQGYAAATVVLEG